MRLIPISVDQYGNVLEPSDFYKNEMTDGFYNYNKRYTDHPGFYHLQRFHAAHFVDMEFELERFYTYMQRYHTNTFVNITQKKKIYPNGSMVIDLMYAIKGPIPADAENGNWFVNMARYRYQMV